MLIDAVEGEEDEEDDRQGLMGGPKSLLCFAESLRWTTSTAPLATDQQKQPWLKGDTTGDDTMTKKAEKNMAKIAEEFCTWLRDLPGEDKTVNQIKEP